MTDGTEPIDRHDLEALKDWIKAEFRVVGATLHGMDAAITLAAEERATKDAELNDVRSRFIPREVHVELEKRVTNLEKTTASTEAVNGYKRIVYGAIVTAAIAVAIALFNARPPGG